MEKIETKEVDDKFDVLAEITQMDVDEDEEARLAEKAERKRLRKTMTPEEKEAQRKINRENREKKKQKKDLNKKRKVKKKDPFFNTSFSWLKNKTVNM